MQYLADARDLARSVDQIYDRAAAHAGDLAHAGVLADELASARNFAVRLASARNFGGRLASVLADDRTVALDRVRFLVRDFADELAIARDFVASPANARYLDNALARVRVRARYLDRALADALAEFLDLGLNTRVDVDAATLFAALNDFTSADLREADLTGTHLEGVRWSRHSTRWPRSLDVEQLENDSEETPPGSGIFVVRRWRSVHEFDWAR